MKQCMSQDSLEKFFFVFHGGGLGGNYMYSIPLPSTCMYPRPENVASHFTSLCQLINHIPQGSQRGAFHCWNGNWTRLDMSLPQNGQCTRRTHNSYPELFITLKWWPQFLCLFQGSLATHDDTQDQHRQANNSTGYTFPYQSVRVQHLAAIQPKNSVCRQRNNTIQ